MNIKLKALSLLLFSAACGAEAPGARATLQLPESRHSRMALSAALDVSSLPDVQLLDRVVLDEIIVNVADVRLLGADPRVPTGGLRLTSDERQVSSLEGQVAFPLPGNLSLDDLALFVELAPSSALDGASVLVRARLFETPQVGSALQLRQEPDPDGSPAYDPKKGEPDPDGSPAKEDPKKGEPDPDGSPALGGPRCEPDPDGSPALKRCKQGLNGGDFVAFELRGSDTADLLVNLSATDPFDVVVGIPAARWFTPEAIQTLETALDKSPVTEAHTASGGAEEKPVVVSSTPRAMNANAQGSNSSMPAQGSEDEYRLLGDGDADPRDIRRR